MNEGDAIDLVQSAIWMVVVGAGPCVGAAMAVGVVIALLQALTQIQEMTLTFVPKMIAVFVAASLTASFVGAKFSIFTQSIYARIEGYKSAHSIGNCELIHFASAALTSAGFSCAIQWPEGIVTSVRLLQWARIGSARRETRVSQT